MCLNCNCSYNCSCKNYNPLHALRLHGHLSLQTALTLKKMTQKLVGTVALVLVFVLALALVLVLVLALISVQPQVQVRVLVQVSPLASMTLRSWK